MALYRYEAVSSAGELLRGEIEAASQAAVIAHLHQLGNVPIRAETAGSWSGLVAGLFGTARSSRPGDLGSLTQHLATLLGAGLSLDRALEIGRRVAAAGDQRTLGALLDRVRGGSSLADAMAASGGLFPAYYVGMVRAGEAGGSLDATLRHLGAFLERAKAVREQVKSALIYPLIVLATGAASLLVLFGFVIPTFRPLFDEAGATLPLPARLVLGLGEGLRDYWYVCALAALVMALLVGWQIRRPDTRHWLDRRVLGLPVIGDLVAKTELGRFCRTLGTLLQNGVAPLAGLSIAAETFANTALRSGVDAVAAQVKDGKGLAEPLAQMPLVPVLVADLVRVGEETARLDDMLGRIAEIYEAETQRGISRLMALLVPGITIILGVVVAAVIGSVLTAVLSVYDLAV